MARGRKPMTFEIFQSQYLIENFTDNKGNPKHTRLIKGHMYDFSAMLLSEYGFDMYTCHDCGLTEWRGRPIVLQLEHINAVINDSRIENLKMLCPNCHSQTQTYCGRKTPHDIHVEKLKERTKNGI